MQKVETDLGNDLFEECNTKTRKSLIREENNQLNMYCAELCEAFYLWANKSLQISVSYGENCSKFNRRNPAKIWPLERSELQILGFRD